MSFLFPPFRRYSVAIASLVLLVVLRAEAQKVEPRYDPEGSKRQFDSLLNARQIQKGDDPDEEDVEGREAWFYYQRAFPYDVVPADARLKGVMQTQAMERRLDEARALNKRSSSLLDVKQWEQVGPYNITGRIRGLSLDPMGSGTLYVGAASGGVWKNNGIDQNTWTSNFDKLSSIAVGAVATDPTDPNIVYAGTGEPLSAVSTYNASPAYWGSGMFKSTDGGGTWNNIGLGNVPAFSKIFVHRQNHNIVYAAGNQSGSNFYRSEDGGQTWTNGFASATSLFDMAVNPVNSNTVFVTTTGGIWRSYDGGKTGTFKNILQTSVIPVNSCRGISIAISASDTNVLYVMTARYILNDGSGAKDQGDVYVTTNGGTSWKKVTTFGADFFRDQGYYDNCIAVNPADPDVVVVGGVQLMYTNEGRTVNGQWTVVGNEVGLHPDQHVIEYDPSNPDVVYVGNDGGLWVSYDGGGTWQRYSLRLPITQFYQIDVDQTREFRVYGGTQDNGTNGALSDVKFADQWTALVGGDGFFVVVDKTDPNVIYGEIYYGNISRNDGQRLDGSIPSSDQGQWSTPMAMSPADKTTLYQGRSKLYRLPDPRGGTLSWETLDPGIGGDKISAIGLSPFDAKKMLIGSAGGQLRYSLDNGKTWATSKGIQNRYVTDVVYDPVQDGRVYAVISGTGVGHIFRSEDNGANFVNLTNNLPDVPTNAIEIDPNNNAHLFVGNDVGMYLSVDGGTSWLPFNRGLPYVPIADLKIQNKYRKLYAGTYGRSMFRIDIDDAEGEPFVIAPAAGASVSTPGILTARWSGFSSPVRVQLSYDNGATFQLLGQDIPPTQTSITYQLPIIKTDQAKIRVTEQSTGLIAESGLFSIKPIANATTLPKSGVAEAISVRKGEIWITVRGSDSIYVLQPTIFTTKRGKLRTGFAGKIHALAYDQTQDLFYALVTDNDFGNPQIFKMDTNGTGQGQVILPTQAPTKISGIAITPQGLALVSPGKSGVITVIDPTVSPAAFVSQSSPLVDASGDQRIGLAWDTYGYVQAVVDARPGEPYPSELQLEKVTDQFRVHQRQQAITPAGGTVYFYAITYDPTSTGSSQISYLATDTTGTIYRFTRSAIFSGVEGNAVAGVQSSGLEITNVMPNPLRGQGTATFRSSTRSAVTLDLYTSVGDRVARLFDGVVEAGSQTVSFDASSIPSGVYYLTLTTPSGDRVVRPVAVMK